MSKSVETEVKYKVNKLPENSPTPLEFRQIYFDGSLKTKELKELFPKIDLNIISTFRVRRIKQDKVTYVLTLKTKAIGYSRGEFEIEISEAIFNTLIKDNVLSEIIKNRYVLNYDGFTFEFDKYFNLKCDLVTCEVEVEKVSNDVLNNIEDILTNHFKVEFENVSDDVRYRNSNLIKYFG